MAVLMKIILCERLKMMCSFTLFLTSDALGTSQVVEERATEKKDGKLLFVPPQIPMESRNLNRWRVHFENIEVERRSWRRG